MEDVFICLSDMHAEHRQCLKAIILSPRFVESGSHIEPRDVIIPKADSTLFHHKSLLHNKYLKGPYPTLLLQPFSLPLLKRINFPHKSTHNVIWVSCTVYINCIHLFSHYHPLKLNWLFF